MEKHVFLNLCTDATWKLWLFLNKNNNLRFSCFSHTHNSGEKHSSIQNFEWYICRKLEKIIYPLLNPCVMVETMTNEPFRLQILFFSIFKEPWNSLCVDWQARASSCSWSRTVWISKCRENIYFTALNLVSFCQRFWVLLSNRLIANKFLLQLFYTANNRLTLGVEWVNLLPSCYGFYFASAILSFTFSFVIIRLYFLLSSL